MIQTTNIIRNKLWLRVASDYPRFESAAFVDTRAEWMKFVVRLAQMQTDATFPYTWKPSKEFVSARKWNCVGKATRYSITVMRPRMVLHRELRSEGADYAS